MTTRRIAILFLVFSFFLGAIALAAEATAEKGHEGEAEHGESIWATLGKWVNFAALVYLLYLFFTKTIKVQDRFKEDYHQIQRSIESARQAKEEAERRLAELDARMATVGDEIKKMKEDAAQDAEEEKKRILESAHREAERLLDAAHKEIDSQVEFARQELQRKVADLAVARGQEIIKSEIDEKDQKRLIRDYIEGFGK